MLGIGRHVATRSRALLAPALVAVGGFAGAALRHAVSLAVTGPGGTLAANVVGCALLGALLHEATLGRRLSRDALLLAGVGACGAYTTFSSFAHDTVRLVEAGHPRRGAGYAVGTLGAALGGVLAAWLLLG